MKVLEERPWTKTYNCTGFGNGNRGCNSLLEVEKDDLRYFALEFPWPIQPEAVCFKCPLCNAMTDIPKEDWPNNYTKLEKWTSAWAGFS